MVELPATAAWRLVDAHDGFEVLFLSRDGEGYRFEGQSTGVEEGQAWSISYVLVVDSGWATRSAELVGRTERGAHRLRLQGDGSGEWRLDGASAPHLDGLLDVDLEGSAFTNALPMHRLGLRVGESADAPAAYVRESDLTVERMEQRYTRLEDDSGRRRFDYESPGFDYRDELVYDENGLLLAYPGIAERVL